MFCIYLQIHSHNDLARHSGDDAEGLHTWRPIPPDDNFVALGMVVTTTPKMPALNLVRCVPRGTPWLA